MSSDHGREGGRGPARLRGGASRKARAALAALLLCACAAPAGGGPGDLGAPRTSRAGVRFYVLPNPRDGVGTPEMTFHFHDGRQRRQVRSTTFSTENLASPYSPYFETAARDSLRVTAVVHGPAGDTAGTGALTLPLRRDWYWEVTAQVMRRSHLLADPELDPARFRDYWPLRGQEGASDPLVLALRHAGNSISRPGVH